MIKTCLKSLSIFIFSIIAFYVVSANGDTVVYAGVDTIDIENTVDEWMNRQIGDTSPGAAVVIVRDGEVCLEKGYGYADLENKIPVDPESTVFEFGSISKLFVWTSVMQLAEEGKITLDDDIRNYLPPAFASQCRYSNPITMLDVMSHTAGFEEQPFDWLPFSPDGVVTPLEEYLLRHQPKQVYQPGDVIAYSNYGTALAGLAVEYMSGQTFYDYEKEHIFDPVRMEMSTGSPYASDNTRIFETKAKGYIPIGGSQFKEGIWTFLPEYPAGSVNGTIQDLGRLLIALMPGEGENTPLFQNRSTLDRMLSQSYTPTPGMPSNAHGFWEYENEERYLYHPGETASFTGNIVFSPDKRFGFAVLANAAEANDLVYGLSNLLLDSHEPYVLPIQTEDLPDSHEVSGDYLLAMSCYGNLFEVISHIAGKVKVRAVGAREITLDIGGESVNYTQVSPYQYRLTNAPSSVVSFMSRNLFFEVREDKVRRISTGNMDIVPFQPVRNVITFEFSVILSAVFFMFFFVAPIVLWIIWIRLKRKAVDGSRKIKRQFFSVFCLTITGTAMVLNNLCMICFALTNLFHNGYPFRTHILINWIILFIMIVLFAVGIYPYKVFSSKSKIRTFAYVDIALLLAMTALLSNWHFFNAWF